MTPNCSSWSCGAALELRDGATEGHSRRVTDLTLRLSRVAGVGEDALVHIRRGCLLHDIGKMGVPDRILLKPTKPTAEEVLGVGSWRLGVDQAQPPSPI